MAEKKKQNKKPVVGDYPEYLNPPFVKPALPQRPDKKDIEENTTPSKSAMDALDKQAKDNEQDRNNDAGYKAYMESQGNSMVTPPNEFKKLPMGVSSPQKKAKGGTVKYARGGGIEQRGKTRGKFV